MLFPEATEWLRKSLTSYTGVSLHTFLFLWTVIIAVVSDYGIENLKWVLG